MPVPTTCSADGCVFSTMSGYGVPHGKVKLQAFRVGGDRCERYDEIMAPHEARAEGLRQGFLVLFRDTESFNNLCRSFLARSPDSFLALCEREGVDPEAKLKELEV